jgi:hypothetical protein
MKSAKFGKSLLASVATLLLLPAGAGLAQQSHAPGARAASAASDIANAFSQIGDGIYEHCIFELSQEQIEVQQALIGAYVKQGASHALARQLAVKQIRPPKLSDECQQIKNQSKPAPPAAASTPWAAKTARTETPAPKVEAPATRITSPRGPTPTISLTAKTVLPHWDCAPGVDYVTIQHRGYERKLTDGEICSPFEDIVHRVPDQITTFRFGYTIRTGRLFIITDERQYTGRTVAWAISGREACRNNPDPDCLATRAVGPLPPGEYSFASDRASRVSWGPKSKRMVAGIYLTKLWHREQYTSAQTAAILARGNIAIHVRLKGEMSEACLGLEPNGWEYVASLIKEGRATGVSVYIDEPYPQIAEKSPPIVKASSFSLSSLFR